MFKFNTLLNPNHLLQHMIWVDHLCLEQIKKIHRPYIDVLMKALTFSGSGIVWLLTVSTLSLVYFFYELSSGMLIFLNSMLASLCAWIIGNIIRVLIHRPRPDLTIHGHKALIKTPKASSFPSTHTATSMALFSATWTMNHSWSLFIGIWALLVSFSRLYLGVHFLSDVVAGISLGLVVGYGAMFNILNLW